MVEYSNEEFKKLLAEGISEFNKIMLNNLTLVNKELIDIRFINCNFNEIKISKSTLKDIYFENCTIQKCYFEESELDYIEIHKTNVKETEFLKCLVNSKDQHVWNEVVFKQCTFKLFKIWSAVEIGYSVFEDCNFDNTIIGCPEFFSCKITNSDMRSININSGIANCEFKSVNLENSELEHLYSGNSFRETCFKNALLKGTIDLNRENFKDLNLQGAKLWAVHPYEYVNLEGFNLSKVDMEAVEWQEANLKGCNLEEANMLEAELVDANLEEANLKSANLEDANLENANLKYSNLEGANLEGTNFDGADLEGVIILEKDYHYIEDYISKDKITLI